MCCNCAVIVTTQLQHMYIRKYWLFLKYLLLSNVLFIQHISAPAHSSTISTINKGFLRILCHSCLVIESVNAEMEIPDECPVCRKVSKNLLLHIRKRSECSSSIDPELFSSWREAAHKRKSRKAQSKYIQKGRHKEVQAKYAKKCKEEDEESFLQIQRHTYARRRERLFRRRDYKKYKRMNSFRKLCIRMLSCLRRGECPPEHWLNKFHLIEHEICSRYVDKDGNEYDPDKLHGWLKEVDLRLLIMVISFQKIALVPRSYWKKAQKQVETPKKAHLRECLYKLIGKLQAYKHKNTKDITIPDEFKSNCKATEDKLQIWDSIPDDFSGEDEKLLVDLLEDIFDHDDINDQEMEDLLKITHHMDVLDVASLYSKL